MSSNAKGGSRRRKPATRMWAHAEAKAASPYLGSIMRSLRETALEARRLHQAARLLAERPGRPDRARLIAQEEITRKTHQVEANHQQALDELMALDVALVDPIQGLALMPFTRDEQPAWYVYDHFAADPVHFWRYASDPPQTRRPITRNLKGAIETTWLS